MNKKSFFTFLLSFLCLSLSAETVTTEFTYDKGNIGLYGTAKRETMDMAIRINNPSLAGMKIKSVKAYIGVSDGISEPSVWISEELNLDKKVNSPDICSIEVPVEACKYTDPVSGNGFNAGMLTADFDQPYVLTDKPVYLGFSFTVDNIDDDYHKYPLLISQVPDQDGFFFHTNKTVIHWASYTEKVGGVLPVYVTLEGNFSEFELGIKDIETLYIKESEPFTANVSVSNTGKASIQSLKYSYSFDGSTETNEGYLTLPSPIAPDLNSSSEIQLSFEGISGLGNHELHLSIDEINGVDNTSVAKSYTKNVVVMPFVPVHRPLIEEYTGLWCQYCPRGYIGMELINEFYGENQVSICYHNNDDMMVTAVYPMEPSGYPLSSIDRMGFIDPYYGSYQDIDFGIRKNIDARIAELAPCDIILNATIEGDQVNVTSTTRFIKDLKDVNYQIGYVLVCNDLSDPSWLQSNAYSGAAGFEGTYLEPATKWSKNVRGLVFNDVAVDVAGMKGVEGSLPEEMTMNTDYEHSFTFNIGDNKLINDRRNLVVTAFVIDQKTKTVINANKFSLASEASVGITLSENEVEKTEYYDLTGRKVRNPEKGILIRVDTLTDGTVKSTKIKL